MPFQKYRIFSSRKRKKSNFSLFLQGFTKDFPCFFAFVDSFYTICYDIKVNASAFARSNLCIIGVKSSKT